MRDYHDTVTLIKVYNTRFSSGDMYTNKILNCYYTDSNDYYKSFEDRNKERCFIMKYHPELHKEVYYE